MIAILGPKKRNPIKKIVSKPFRLLQLALVGCKDGRSSQAAFCHQNVWLNIFFKTLSATTTCTCRLQGRSEFTGCLLPPKCLAKHFRGKSLLSFIMVLLRKKRQRKKTNKYRFGGTTLLQSQIRAQNQGRVSSTILLHVDSFPPL